MGGRKITEELGEKRSKPSGVTALEIGFMVFVAAIGSWYAWRLGQLVCQRPDDVYLDCVQAFERGDVAAARGCLTRKRAARFDTCRSRSQDGKLSDCFDWRPRNDIIITSISVTGNTASIRAKQRDLRLDYTVKMIRQWGAWKIDEEMWDTVESCAGSV